MISATADSNVYISALGFGGLPLQFLQAAHAGVFRLVVSGAILQEIAGVLSDKFNWEANRISEQLDEIAYFAHRIDPPETLRVIAADPDDDRVLECAVAGECSFIVTGDKHLLVLGTYGEARILKVADFLEILNSTLEVR